MENGTCRDCGKTDMKLNMIGVCPDCEAIRSEAVLRSLEQERNTITIDELIAAIEDASTPDDVGAAFGKCEPPADPMEQEVLRERLVRALESKVKRPGGFVDAWLKRAPSADDQLRIAKDATLLVKLAREHATLFHDRSQEPFALIEVGGHKETYRIGSRYFKRWLARLYYEDANAKPARSQDESVCWGRCSGCRAATVRCPTRRRCVTRCFNWRGSPCSRVRSTRSMCGSLSLGSTSTSTSLTRPGAASRSRDPAGRWSTPRRSGSSDPRGCCRSRNQHPAGAWPICACS